MTPRPLPRRPIVVIPPSSPSLLRILHIVTVAGLLLWCFVDDYEHPPQRSPGRAPMLPQVHRLYTDSLDGTAGFAVHREDLQTPFEWRVPCPATVTVLDSSGPKAKVKLMDGPAAGRIGFVRAECVK